MNRREWLQHAAISAGLMAVDPERLLWEPGRKTFFIPKANDDLSIRYIRDWTELNLNQAFEVAGREWKLQMWGAEQHGFYSKTPRDIA